MKTYKLGICERRTYRHDMTIEIPDDRDIDEVCEEAEKAINDGMGDLWAAGYVTGVKIKELVEDEGPDCECEIEEYDEVTEDAEDAEEAEEE